MKLLLYYFFVLIISVQFANADCGKQFENIDANCIGQYKSKMQKTLIVIPEKPEELVDMTYFYQTASGNVGKFTVKAAESTPLECSLYLEATTYISGRSYNPSASFTIKNAYNNWSQDKTSFDENINEDFVLKRVKNQCVLEAVDAKVVKYKSTKEEALYEGKMLLFYAAHFLIGLAVFLVASAVFRDEEKFKATEKLDEAEQNITSKSTSNDIVLKYSRPFFKRYFSPVVNGMKNKKRFKDSYKRKLATAGLTQELTPEDFFAFKLFLIIGFPILFLGLRAFLEETWPLAYVPIVSVIGFFYPNIWLSGKIEQRKADVIKGMPFIVDMLALSVEAGLDFVAAMQKVIEKAPRSPLVDEFETLIKETKVGSSRAEALRQLSWRVDTIQVSSFCATLIAADAVGASIGPILKTLSKEIRQARSAIAEKKGATAATKIIIPTIFLIIPSVGIVIMGPVVMQLMVGG